MGDHGISAVFWGYASRLTDADLIKLFRLGGSSDSEIQTYVRKLKSPTTSVNETKCDALRKWAQCTDRTTAKEMDELLTVLETLVHSNYNFTHNNWKRAENLLREITYGDNIPVLLHSHIIARNTYKVIEEESTKDDWMMFVREELLSNRSAKILEIQKYYESVGDVEMNYQFILQWKLINPGGDVAAIGGMFLNFIRRMRGSVDAQRRNNAQQHGPGGMEASSFEVLPPSSLEQGNNNRITQPTSEENDEIETDTADNSNRVVAVVSPIQHVSNDQFLSGSASASDSYHSAQSDVSLTARRPVEQMMKAVSINNGHGTATDAIIQTDVAGPSRRRTVQKVDTESGNDNHRPVLTNEIFPAIDQPASVPYSSMLYPSGYPEMITHDGNLAAGYNTNSSPRNVESDEPENENTQTELHVLQLNNEIKPLQDKAFASSQVNRKK